MALIWSAAAPPGGPGRGAGAVGGGGGGEGESEGGGWCMPSVTLHPPGTAVPGVEGCGRGGEGLVGLERWGSGWRWVVTLI